MRTAIYVIWILVIVGYFLLGLWSMLEKAGDKVNKKAKHEATDIFKQLIFVIAIIAACFDPVMGVFQGCRAFAPDRILGGGRWPLLARISATACAAFALGNFASDDLEPAME